MDDNQQSLSEPQDFERLSLALLRYASEPEAMCDDVIADADAVSLSFLRGWFSSRDVVEVMRPAIGRVVRASHVHEDDHSHESHESHEEEEEDHEDEDHDHERRRRDNHVEEEDHMDDEGVETATEDSHDHDEHSEEDDHEDDEHSHSDEDS